MKRLITNYPIGSFLIINYLISWSFLYPSYQLILTNEKITPLAFIGLVGAYGPTIAAIIVQRVIDKEKVKSLLKTIVKVKTSWQLILFVLIGPIVLYALAYLIAVIAFNGEIKINWILGFSNIPIWFLLALPFGPMGEELGWRGFLLPKLLEKYSIIKSTFLVGVAWGVWHLASFTFPGAAIPDFMAVSVWTIVLFCANTIALSMVYTYVHLKSNGSVFLAILLHAFFNAAASIISDFFGKTEATSMMVTAYCLNIILALLLGYLMIKKDKKLNKVF